MLLYDAAISGNAWKVRQLFAHLGLDYETRDIDVVERSERAAIIGPLNPTLRIPVVVLDDGTALAESNAILVRFAEGTDYLPGDPVARGEVLRWMFFEQANHQPYLAMAWFLTCVMPGEPDANVLGFLHLMGKMALKGMEQHLATVGTPFFACDQYTIADTALYPYVARASEAGFDLERYGEIRAWLSRVEAQPGFIRPVTKVVA